jgi:Flp pilus assembly protein TadG
MARDQRGAATAELALGIPLLVSLTFGLVWLLAVGVSQVRMVDAARETARAGARGESTTEAITRGRQVAPGATITLATSDDGVQAVSTQLVAPPGGLLGFLPRVRVHAQAVAATEALG